MKNERLVLSIFLLLVATLTLFDVYEDLSEGAKIGHLALEICISIFGFSGTLYLFSLYRKEQFIVNRLKGEKQELKELADKYQQNSEVFLEGLSSHIDKNFTNWGLTDAERDVAILLLKGVSPKKIAEIRDRSEKTVRHQITSIYKKSGQNGREEFTAFFLEDLLAPGTELKS